jgi:hypothetical protein
LEVEGELTRLGPTAEQDEHDESPRHVTVDGGEIRDGDRAIDLLDGSAPARPLGTPTLECKLESYGFLWMRLQHEDQRTVP